MKKTIITVMALSLTVLIASAGIYAYDRQQSNHSVEAFAAMSDALQRSITAYAEGAPADTIQMPLSFPAASQMMGPLPETDNPAILAYREMAAEQPDMVGWLKIDGTVIDYPVMRSPQEPEKYLHLGFDETYSRAGTLFMLPISDPSVPNENTIIYGHHMKDGSMFGSLTAYEKKEAFDEQPYIQFDTIYGEGMYKIVAVFRTSIGAEDEFPYYHYEWLEDEETFDRYMRGVMANRLYDTGETAEYGDQLLSLSTCDYHEPNGRLVVVAKKIVETEETGNA